MLIIWYFFYISFYFHIKHHILLPSFPLWVSFKLSLPSILSSNCVIVSRKKSFHRGTLPRLPLERGKFRTDQQFHRLFDSDKRGRAASSNYTGLRVAAVHLCFGEGWEGGWVSNPSHVRFTPREPRVTRCSRFDNAAHLPLPLSLSSISLPLSKPFPGKQRCKSDFICPTPRYDQLESSIPRVVGWLE